jgi:hypothetical protein
MKIQLGVVIGYLLLSCARSQHGAATPDRTRALATNAAHSEERVQLRATREESPSDEPAETSALETLAPADATAKSNAPEPAPMPKDLGRDLSRRLSRWVSRWSSLIRDFSLDKFALQEAWTMSAEVLQPADEYSSVNRVYNLEFLRRHRSLFRVAPAGKFWADIFVATFSLDQPDGARAPFVASVDDTSYLYLVDPKSGASRPIHVVGLACGFYDASWRDSERLVAVGSCVEEGVEGQRPFVVHANLSTLALEVYTYPSVGRARFDLEQYISARQPEIVFEH